MYWCTASTTMMFNSDDICELPYKVKGEHLLDELYESL